jgi:hypothetical protein
MQRTLFYLRFVPFCWIECTLPATVMEPLLEFLPVYGATEYATVPLPVPEPAEVILIQLTEADAAQLQVLPVVREKLPTPPEEEKVLLVGDME